LRAEDDHIGKTIAQKYRVEALIGEGGMGKVFRARQLMLDKVVVLKVLRQSLLGDERTVARFQREAKAASRLNHPNSISILDFGQTEDGALFIAMEYVAGQDLHQLLSREWPLPEARVVRIIAQVLSALSDAHGAGVIHRDLKPENIMLEQRRGEPDFVKVLDFGIAKITDSSGEEGPALTRAGFVCGTPEYMSPEQARGATLDQRSDLYAVGVILYQLMTGLLPFESDSAVGFATKHLTEEPPPPTQRRPDAKISPAMERLILRVLSKNPNDRPSNAEEFRVELLEVDKERRRAEGGARKPKTKTAPVLAPLPRRATPGDNIDTNPSTTPAWSAASHAESTVRAVPELMRTVPNPVPTRGATDEQLPSVPPPTGGFGFLKALTILMVLAAAGLAYYFFYLRITPPDEPFVLPPNAPVPGAESRGPAAAPDQLHAQNVSEQDVKESGKSEQEGDGFYKSGNLQSAANAYRQAFQHNPRPVLALKLFSVFRIIHPDEAPTWYRRYVEMVPGSKVPTLFQDEVQGGVASSSGN
jgi:serine/threonine-protein kinase